MTDGTAGTGDDTAGPADGPDRATWVVGLSLLAGFVVVPWIAVALDLRWWAGLPLFLLVTVGIPVVYVAATGERGDAGDDG